MQPTIANFASDRCQRDGQWHLPGICPGQSFSSSLHQLPWNPPQTVNDDLKVSTALQGGLISVGEVSGIAVPMSTACASLSLAAKIPISYLAGSLVGGGLALVDTMLALYAVNLTPAASP